MGENLGSNPAFPLEYKEYNSCGVLCERQEFGISQRLYIATKAMQSLLSNPALNKTDLTCSKTIIASQSFIIADEMLKQGME